MVVKTMEIADEKKNVTLDENCETAFRMDFKNFLD